MITDEEWQYVNGDWQPPKFQLVPFTNFAPAATTYLVPNLPDRELVVLVGEEGIGKGLWWCWLVDQVTRAGHNVLIIATEDDYSRTVRPRFDVLGVDPARVFAILSDPDEQTGHPILPGDLQEVENAVRTQQIRLVVIDPWVSTVSGKLKLRDTQDARRAVDVLTIVARRTGCTILAVAHPNRGEGSLRDRVGLTAVLRQSARVMLYALEPPTDRTRLYVGVEKANGSDRPPAELFTKEGVRHHDPRIGKVWRVTPTEPDMLLRIAEWDRVFSEQRDHRRTDRWVEVKGTAATNNGLITRADIIAIYTKADSPAPDSSADKAIGRWLRTGRLTQQSSGVYEVGP